MPKLRRVVVATLVLPGVLLGSACTKAQPSVTGSTQTQSRSVTASPTATVHTDKASFVRALKGSTLEVKTVHMTMKMAGQGQEVELEGDSKLDPARPATKMTMSMSGLHLELIVVDAKVYVKGIPGQGDGTKWAVLDAESAMAKELGSSAKQLDPAQMYDEFDRAVTDVKHVGQETVDGEQMSKYELTMDSKSLRDLPAGAQLTKTLTYTAWLDARDRMRKVTFELSGVQAVITMSRYGEPVEIAAPPADETVATK